MLFLCLSKFRRYATTAQKPERIHLQPQRLQDKESWWSSGGKRPVKDKKAIKNSWYEFMKDKSYLANLTASYDEVAGYLEKEKASGYNRSWLQSSFWNHFQQYFHSQTEEIWHEQAGCWMNWKPPVLLGSVGSNWWLDNLPGGLQQGEYSRGWC